PSAFLLVSLKIIQNGVSPWIVDSDSLFSSKHHNNDSQPIKMLERSYNSLTTAIRSLPHHNSHILDTLSTLITTGLSSARKSIAETAVEAWNATFGREAHIDYPTNVSEALQKLRPIADLH